MVSRSMTSISTNPESTKFLSSSQPIPPAPTTSTYMHYILYARMCERYVCWMCALCFTASLKQRRVTKQNLGVFDSFQSGCRQGTLHLCCLFGLVFLVIGLFFVVFLVVVVLLVVVLVVVVVSVFFLKLGRKWPELKKTSQNQSKKMGVSSHFWLHVSSLLLVALPFKKNKQWLPVSTHVSNTNLYIGGTEEQLPLMGSCLRKKQFVSVAVIGLDGAGKSSIVRSVKLACQSL